jgi:hypothetical protein
VLRGIGREGQRSRRRLTLFLKSRQRERRKTTRKLSKLPKKASVKRKKLWLQNLPRRSV